MRILHGWPDPGGWRVDQLASTHLHMHALLHQMCENDGDSIWNEMLAMAGECVKTGVCSTIGPVPFYKASGTCLACPPAEEVGTAVQVIGVLVLIGGGGAYIWFSSGFSEAPEVELDTGVGAAAVYGMGSELLGTVSIL